MGRNSLTGATSQLAGMAGNSPVSGPGWKSPPSAVQRGGWKPRFISTRQEAILLHIPARGQRMTRHGWDLVQPVGPIVKCPRMNPSRFAPSRIRE